jgi:hypothetical protein
MDMAGGMADGGTGEPEPLLGSVLVSGSYVAAGACPSYRGNGGR